MTARIHRTDDRMVVHLSDDLDLAVRESLRRAFAPLVEQTEAVVDVSAVGFADTTLLSAIVRLVRQRRACGNDLPPRFLGMRASIRRLLAITNVDRLVAFPADDFATD